MSGRIGQGALLDDRTRLGLSADNFGGVERVS